MNAKKKYSYQEFQELEHVTIQALMEKRVLVSRNGEVEWYYVFDSPDGQIITYREWDTSGIQHLASMEMRFIHSRFKLQPKNLPKLVSIIENKKPTWTMPDPDRDDYEHSI